MKKTARVKNVFTSVLLFVCFAASSCSSAPEKPAEVFTARNAISSKLVLANGMANRGKYGDALFILEDVRKSAAAVDDPPLIIKAAIAMGGVLFSMGRREEAFSLWESAAETGDEAGETNLASAARIAVCRGRLAALSTGESGSVDAAAAEEIRAQAEREISAINGDERGLASGWVVIALALKELGRYAEAESAAARALNIHERGLYLEETAYDWYLIASILSVAGEYERAVNALKTAISFDRRAENGFGIASSWQALGDVYLKAGDAAGSASAYRRAAVIYRANGLEDLALRAESRIKE